MILYTHRTRRDIMFMAVAVEPQVGAKNRTDYRIWFLELNSRKQVIGIGVKSKEQLVNELFENYGKYGETNWRAFQKDRSVSTPIEVFDFIAMNTMENTHFGNLPTLAEFQGVLDHLQMNLEIRAIA